MNHLKNNIKTYISSFKNKSILLILVLNTSFIVITAGIIQLIKIISNPWIDKINQINPQDIIFQTETELQQITTTLRSFAIFSIIVALSFIILLIINWSFFQGLIYKILLKKRFNLKYLKKFLLLNLIWFIPWLLLFYVIISAAKLDYLIISSSILTLLFLHFSFILYTLSAESNKLQIKKSLKLGITKLHYFIIPYILITITFIIISQLNLLNINIFIISLVYLLFFSWLQNYTKEITEKIKA